MSKALTLDFDTLLQKVVEVLLAGGFSKVHALAIARVIVCAERDACRSHGLYRIAGVLKTLQQGGADGQALPEVQSFADKALVKVNAKGGFSPLAFELGAQALVKQAKRFGIAALAIRDCVHFSALWPEIEQLTEAGVAALAMCPSSAYVAPAGGIAKLLGTNPFAFGWPRENHPPYVFDFATSVAARGEVELLHLDGKPLPEGWGIDAKGNPTHSPEAALEGALLPFGGYKGSAISTMIEILAGIWIDDKLSVESSEFDAGRGLMPHHGELVLAFNPAAFGADNLAQHAETFFHQFTEQGARLPSLRRYAAREKAQQTGIVVSDENLQRLEKMAGGDFTDPIR